ncbi:MAG: LamG-like jellyroll fold domain-containing protein, partial [Planctomycetota bacterium]
MLRSIRVWFLVCILVFFFAGVQAEPFISEFLSDNDNNLLDEDGDSSDWVEIAHRGDEDVDLEGWYLTDDPKNLEKWRFPNVSLQSGDFVLVFASGKDRTDGELHASFRLTSGGGYLALVHPDGATIVSEFAPYPAQRRDVSFGVGTRVSPDKLIDRSDSCRVHVPNSPALGLSWTETDFDDSNPNWFESTLSLGFSSNDGLSSVDPLAYWSFDTSTRDETGNGHDASNRGAEVSSDVPTAIGTGRSLRFDGTSDYLSADIDVSELHFTSSMWIKTSSVGHGLFCVVDQDLGGGGHDRHIYFDVRNIATRVWREEVITSSGRNLADGRWHHIAHVVSPDIGGQRIYVDGTVAASGTKSSSDFNWQQRINIGFSNDAANRFFNGLVDDVAVWDHALTTAQVQALAAGATPTALAGIAPLVESDISEEMLGTNSSVYIRAPFELSLPLNAPTLQLRVRYEDGFTAYLNGAEITRRNAPGTLSFDSRSSTDRPDLDAVALEVIDLAPHLEHLRDGNNVLAIHAMNDSAENSEFLFQAEIVRVEESVERYFSTPTPGAANDFGVIEFVADTKFSLDRGLYDAPFDVAVSTETEGAAIYTTTDGSEPGPENPEADLYDGPIRIATTTTLRAAAFKEDFEPTNVDTHTYIFIDHVLSQPPLPPGVPSTWSGNFPADYGVDPDVINTALPGYRVEDALRALPTVSVTTTPENLFDSATGIYANSSARGPAWERPASFELFYPDGSPGFQVDAGIRMHGNSSRNHGFTPKHPIRVLFKTQYGESKLREKVFPDSDVDRFDQLLLRGASTDSWPVVNGNSVLGVQRWNPLHATYIRDQWMRDAQNDLGHPSGHGIYVQLYLNGLYWGLYNIAERPTDSFQEEYFGGEKDEYDVMKDFAELQSGQRNAWDAMIALANQGLSSTAAYQRIQGRNPDGTVNPDYPNYLNVDNLVDYMILHIYAGAEDWPDHNWWAARRRGPESEGYRFFVWDQEISNDSLVRTHTRIQTRFEDPITRASPSLLYGRLMQNTDFRQTFIDRVQRHLFGDGELTQDRSVERWQTLQTTIDLAIVGESARWGDSKKAVPYKREIEWLDEMNWMHDSYWPEVHDLAIARFRRVGLYPAVNAPAFMVDGVAQHGGGFTPGARLSMEVGRSSPRVVEEFFIDQNTQVSAHVPNDLSLGSDWRGLDYIEGEAGEQWRSGENGVGYENSSGYENVISIDVGDAMSGAGGNNSVYVRIEFE